MPRRTANIQPGGVQGALLAVAYQPMEWLAITCDEKEGNAVGNGQETASATVCRTARGRLPGHGDGDGVGRAA